MPSPRKDQRLKTEKLFKTCSGRLWCGWFILMGDLSTGCPRGILELSRKRVLNIRMQLMWATQRPYQAPLNVARLRETLAAIKRM
mmetsp:Transcript_9058/g.22234  ORF Transcript_9058/g.22234 Transcript_9058/m.22234 type:complete len:85 (+) Transcript_9058:2210-2464(+)